MRHPLLQQVKAKAAVEALKELESGLGWSLIMAFIDENLLKAAEGMGQNPNMQDSEIHYRRGAINATTNLKMLPDQLVNYFTNQHILDESKEKIDG